MRAIVHFSVGVSGMLLLLLLLDLEERYDFVLMFASGFWALVPDLGWVLLRVDMGGVAILWKTLFNSAIGNVFWFHPFLDASEPDSAVIELTSAFVLMFCSVGLYYFANTWNDDRDPRPRRRILSEDRPDDGE